MKSKIKSHWRIIYKDYFNGRKGVLDMGIYAFHTSFPDQKSLKSFLKTREIVYMKKFKADDDSVVEIPSPFMGYRT